MHCTPQLSCVADRCTGPDPLYVPLAPPAEWKPADMEQQAADLPGSGAQSCQTERERKRDTSRESSRSAQFHPYYSLACNGFRRINYVPLLLWNNADLLDTFNKQSLLVRCTFIITFGPLVGRAMGPASGSIILCCFSWGLSLRKNRCRWPERLPALLQAYNNAMHSSTGFAPHYILTGMPGSRMTWQWMCPPPQGNGLWRDGWGHTIVPCPWCTARCWSRCGTSSSGTRQGTIGSLRLPGACAELQAPGAR